MIVVKNATKSFKGQKVLDEVSLVCEEGKIYGIVGYNGSGKTVLFMSISGFYKLDEGQITVNGQIMHHDIHLIEDAGIIIEEPAFLRNYSGYKNLEFLYRLKNKKKKEHLYEVMRLVGLDPTSRKRVCNYSLGMRKRLAIAQAIMEDPSILILDEPMNGLDKNGVHQMRELFSTLKEQGKIILIASHNKEDIELLCDHVYEMDQGQISRLR